MMTTLSKPPLALVQVVGAVGGEVGELAVAADVDAVLVVTEVRGADPRGAVGLVDVARLREPGQGRVELPAFVQVLLVEVHVEAHAEAGERRADLIEHQRHAAAT